MKQNLFAAAVIVLLSSSILPIRSVHSYFDYSFAAVGSAGTSDINLDKSSAVYQTPKSKTATPTLTIEGAKSTIRLKVGAGEFRAHPVAGIEFTSSDDISLFKLNTDKKNRSLSLDASGVITATKVNIYLVQIDAQTYRIAITGGISSPGEYAFVDKKIAAANSTLTLWCFGID